MGIIKKSLTVLLTLACLNATAATITSTTNGGNWNVASTWVGNTIPGVADNVVINGTVVLNTNATCSKVTINSGKTLQFATGGYRLTLKGTWTTVLSNQGTFTANDGKVVFNPTSSAGQTVAGTVLFTHVDLDNVSQMTFSAASTIRGTIRILNSSKITTHPNYGDTSTMEITGTNTISTNYYLWGNSVGKTPAHLVIESGTTSAQQNVIVRKTLLVKSGATLDLSRSCTTLKSGEFTSITNNGTCNLGGVWVESQVNWLLNSSLTISNLTIANGATVNAGSYTLSITYNTTGHCGSSGLLIKQVGTGKFIAANSTVILNTSANGNAGFEGEVMFNNVVFSGGTILTNSNNTSITIEGNLTVNSGASVQYGNPINTGTLNFGTTSTITNNGGTVTNITTSVPSAPDPIVVENSLIELTTNNAGGGTFSNGVKLTAPHAYGLGSNMVINNGRKVLMIYAPAEFKTNGKVLTADSLYVFGKLTVSNANGLDEFLGTTKIYIDSNATIEYDIPNGSQTIKLRQYGKLHLKGNGTKTIGAGILKVKGDLTVEGPVSLDPNSVVEYNGNVNQQVANLTYHTLRVSGSGIKTLADSTTILEKLEVLEQSTLATNNRLILKSDAAHTAFIGSMSNQASITGEVIYQRYIPAGRMWRFIGWPINGSTVANSWQNTIYVTGPGTGGGSLGTQNSNGFDWTASNEASVYTYNESLNAGINNKWQTVPNTSTALSSTKGYRLFVRGSRSQGIVTLNGNSYTPLPVVLQGKGTINKGDISVNLTSSNGGGSTNGWNLLANPYPCAIDWNNPDWIAERNNLQATIYIYNPSQNKYGAWNPVAGSINGASNEIASGQAFFVKTTANTTLTFREAYKSSNSASGLFGKTSSTTSIPKLKIALGEATKKYDETVVYLHPQATKQIDDDFDAIKPDVGNASISTYTSSNTTKLMFNAIAPTPLNSVDTFYMHTPLANATYTYELNFSGATSFNETIEEIRLIDQHLNLSIKVDSTVNKYVFSTLQNNSSSYAAGRFLLVFSHTNQTLPVRLSSFNARKQQSSAILTWVTSFEKSNKHFEVERSADGVYFTKIGVIVGAGNSNVKQTYTFVDEAPFSGVNYYRLVQVDYDNTTTSSAVVQVSFNTLDEALQVAKIYPTVADDIIYVELNNLPNSLLKLQLINQIGQVIHQEQLRKDDDIYTHVMQVDGLSTGVYSLKISDNNQLLFTGKIIKK